MSRESYWFVPFILGPLTGIVVGALCGKLRGALWGMLIGFFAAPLAMAADLVFWLVFSLPPHPKLDL
jgi:hypothetical protein